MPISSPYPTFEVPKQDIWGLMFERKDKPYPDDKGNNLASKKWRS